MHQIKTGRLRLAVIASLLTGHSVVSALEFAPGVGAGLLYTDNAALAADNEEDDLVVVSYVGASVTEDGGPLSINASADVIHLNYTDNTFSDQTYPSLRAIAGWEQIRDRLDWKVQNYFTQTRISAVSGVTPSNIQNTNVFTFGPAISLPISARQTVTVTPEFRDFYYEDVGTDNRQYSLSTNWAYRMYRTMSVGLNGSVVKVDYDRDVPDYTSTDVHVGISGTGARSTYSVNFGRTHTDGDNSSNTGFTGDLSVQYELTGHSSARAYVASNITDTGNILLRSETDPDNGGFSNVQTSDDVVRETIVRLSYRRDDFTLNTRVWGEFRELDYEGGQIDREVKEFGAQLDYRVTPLITTSLSGEYNRVKQTDIGTRDDQYSITGTIAYNFTRKLSAYFDLRYQEQDSDSGSLNEYTEFSSFVRLVYGVATVSRPGGGSRL